MDFKCALWSEKCGSCPDLFTGNHLLTAHAKTCERMLRHRAVYGDNCGEVWVLRTAWCSRRAVHPEEEYREFVIIRDGQMAKFIGQFLVVRENVVLCWKVVSKSCPSATYPFFPG